MKPIHYNKRLKQSVRAFWNSRGSASSRQIKLGKTDTGNRGAVTAGKNLDGFRNMISDVVDKYAPTGTQIHRNKSLVVLPGHFRPTKQWDLLVFHENRLLAALELKSLCGPSFGNNANNRCEEAIGSAFDFRKAQSESLLGKAATPFIGYFILVEDAAASRRPVKAKSPHFPTDPAFDSASYQDRMKILCERMMEQQLYSSAAILVSDQNKDAHCKDLSDQTSLRRFLSKLAGHLAGESAANSGVNYRIKETGHTKSPAEIFTQPIFKSIE